MDNKNALILAGAIALTDSAVKSFIKEPPVKNYGFAGNKMDKHPKAVACVSAALTGGIAVAMAFAPPGIRLPMALILGGALSNSADRLIRGYVVDYIPMGKGFGGRRYYGNISDIAIFAGAGAGAAACLLNGERERPEMKPTKAADG
ncbi:MAG: signal peptidase II [Lachnospiraceae bacterium]|nr:signal peptidase II [Lachnospiraceae bacterium]